MAVARGDVTTATRLVAQARRVSRTDVEALVNAANEHGFTALHSASALENEDAACALTQILLDAGANPHAVDREGFGPMHWAAFVGGTARLRLLQEGGGDVNLPSAKLGDTPLHRACRAGHADTIAALVAAGADTRMQNRAMLAPYDVAGAGDESLLRADVRTRALKALTAADSSLRTLVLHHDDCLRHVTREGHQVSICQRCCLTYIHAAVPGARLCGCAVVLSYACSPPSRLRSCGYSFSPHRHFVASRALMIMLFSPSPHRLCCAGSARARDSNHGAAC